MKCPCGAEAVVISGQLAYCAPHALALDPVELYRLERGASHIRNAPRQRADLARVRRVIAALESPATFGQMNLRKPRGRRRTPAIAVGRKLYG
jgi:hypothetical protein